MLLARILPLQLQASREGGLQSPASKIAETLELLRNRLGPAQLIAQMEAQPKIGETAMDLLPSRFNDNKKPKAT